MKNFKLRQGKNPIYPIRRDIFEKVTNKKKPYFSEFRVTRKKNDQYRLIYSEVLAVDETYYMNLLHKKTTYRNEVLMEMAMKKMPVVLLGKSNEI